MPTKKEEQIETRALVIATGARWRELGVPRERENIGNGVDYKQIVCTMGEGAKASLAAFEYR